MKLAIGTDHRGFKHKKSIKNMLTAIEWLDLGCTSNDRSDYPVFARSVVSALYHKEAEYGVLLCGSGVGMSIAANRFKGIRAALVWNVAVAESAKQDDDANILVIPADFISPELAAACINAWLAATFKSDRYQQRILMLDEPLV